jgi:hypothetical protein
MFLPSYQITTEALSSLKTSHTAPREADDAGPLARLTMLRFSITLLPGLCELGGLKE